MVMNPLWSQLDSLLLHFNVATVNLTLLQEKINGCWSRIHIISKPKFRPVFLGSQMEKIIKRNSLTAFRSTFHLDVQQQLHEALDRSL